MTKTAILNDLAAVDFSFAEYYDEKGVNLLPNVCDGYDTSFLEKNAEEVAQGFVQARQNLEKVVVSLDNERTFENQDALNIVVENFAKRKDYLLSQESFYKKSDFSFVDLYLILKQMQNELGISIPSKETNIFAFMGEDVNIDELVKKILAYIGRLGSFLKESVANFAQFEKQGKSIMQENIIAKLAEKSKDASVKKEKIVKKENSNKKVNDKVAGKSSANSKVGSMSM